MVIIVICPSFIGKFDNAFFSQILSYLCRELSYQKVKWKACSM